MNHFVNKILLAFRTWIEIDAFYFNFRIACNQNDSKFSVYVTPYIDRSGTYLTRIP